MTQQASQPRTSDEPARVFGPAIALPKGGGAIRGVGEKFSANPVTGSGSMTVPIATSEGRSGFGPQLSLSYDSGSGNGPFGFGWTLSLPSVARKTDKGLPRYEDADESDVFILSGAEDLVPVLVRQGAHWVREPLPDRTIAGRTYRLQGYRPRIEGLFARIERWTNRADPADTFWRSITRENVTTWYGKAPESRIADPDDASRIFNWLICESYDDKGNAIVYNYAGETDENVDRTQANERNRTRTANRYLKRIRYGNLVSRLVQPDLATAQWMFEVVFDYGEDHVEEQDFDDGRRHARVLASPLRGRSWRVRPDPFSSYRSGFEVRTYRRCRRVPMFHRFAELGSAPCLVRYTSFDYADLDYSKPTTTDAELEHQGSTRLASFLRSVTQTGSVRDRSAAAVIRNGVSFVPYFARSGPPLMLDYSTARIHDDIREVDRDSLADLPIGLDDAAYRWVDLDGQGLPGILTEQGSAWYYKANLGDARFGAVEQVTLDPSLAVLTEGRQQLLDLAGDGQLDLVAFSAPTPGFCERSRREQWAPFRAFQQLPNVPWDNPNLRFIDLTGDGHADVLVTEQAAFVWHPSFGEEGFGPAARVHGVTEEEQGPVLLLAEERQSIYLADMSGDGLTDLVRIRNGEICYWPNLGYGRFGAKVTMDNAPWLDADDQFTHERVRLADIDGSGTSDIIYLGRDGVRLYFNQSGNRWSARRDLQQFPAVDSLAAVMTADLFGNGTACLTSPLPGDAHHAMRFIDLMGGVKPHLLVMVRKSTIVGRLRGRRPPERSRQMAHRSFSTE